MRKVEQQMLDAINSRRTWHGSNTSVSSIDDVNCAVFLHGNHIADYGYRDGKLDVDSRTLAEWPTPTTKSRLRALGAKVYTKNHTVYLDGQPI